MVLLTLTPSINAALSRVPSSARDELDLPPPVGEVGPHCSISHAQVIQLATCLRQGIDKGDGNAKDDDGHLNRSDVSLDSLLRGTQVHRSQEATKPTVRSAAVRPVWKALPRLIGVPCDSRRKPRNIWL